MQDHLQHLYEMLSKVEGYIYPNEIELQWGILVVLYPYLTGLVAGAWYRIWDIRSEPMRS